MVWWVGGRLRAEESASPRGVMKPSIGFGSSYDARQSAASPFCWGKAALRDAWIRRAGSGGEAALSRQFHMRSRSSLLVASAVT